MKVNREDAAGKSRLKRVARCVAGLVVIAVLAVIGRVLYGQRTAQPPTEVGKVNARPQVPVVVTPAAVRQFERSVAVQGNVEARSWAMVSPRLGGTIETIFAEEGDRVVAGQTKLFAIDQLNLEKAAQIAEYALDVARSATQEKQANFERVEVDLHKAALDYGRFERLREKEAVTADAFEQQQSRHQQLLAMLKHARTLVELSQAQERQAEAALEVARKNLADAVVYAPLDGTVSERLQEPGEMASPGNPILRIDDTSVVEVAVFLPVQYYPEVVAGRTVMNIEVAQTEIRDLVACYRSPTINPRLRTFEVKCLLKDPPAGVVPGAMANVTIVFEKRRGVGVPTSALQQRGGQPVVFVVRDNVAHQVALTTGIESTGWTEVLDGGLDPNAPVISMGQHSVEEGTPVSVRED